MLFIFIFLSIWLLPIHSCPLTDEYLSRCHCGILTNGESYIKCEENSLNEIPKFKRSFPYDELILTNNNIKFLTASSFNNIKTIKRINLVGNALSYIDEDLLRLLGNYLEELTLSGDTEIDTLEFLTRYPLKKLRVLKLNDFNLNHVNLQNIFINMTKLEVLFLQSCQIKQIPHLNHIQVLNLENNLLSKSIFLSTTYAQLNLANNQLSSIILQNNPDLISLNLSRNFLQEFYSLTISNKKLSVLDLSFNHLSTIDWTSLNENLTSLNLSHNHFQQIQINSHPKSLTSLDLSSNQLKALENHPLYEQLTYFNLNHNLLDCNCHLKWLTNLTRQALFTCSSSNDFQCQSMLIPRLLNFNITYITMASKTGLLIEWILIDNHQTLSFIEITVDQMLIKLPANQTRVFISNDIQSNKYYYVCLILIHKYSRDKYCRDVQTWEPLIVNQLDFDNNEIVQSDGKSDHHVYLLLIGTCAGGLLTFILLLTCCYLCYQIRKYKTSNCQPVYEQCSQQYPYPVYHCPHHQIIYNSENLSNSTDSSHIEASLSPTQNRHHHQHHSCNHSKHIYQTIDSQDFSTLNGQNYQIFELWNQSLKHKR
ncbi:unnamed protein product [Adineta ricciae]|uniref:Uncharacterized protein n=1 Tax=Adineta ricciae TaxID=249248 RepID=A0A813W357_ADIRI|nr:unnamed protein product [Adineta ricciae]CAF1642118.1 unnamed protein product [Adineta ricciae]